VNTNNPRRNKVKKFRADPQYIQWRDIAKTEFALNGEVKQAWQIIEKLKPELIEKTEFWGWWRLTDRGYAEYARRAAED
jgi:hypothetical protein